MNKITATILYTIVFASGLFAGVSGLPDFPFVHADGAATRKVKPDAVIVHFQISISGSDSKTAFDEFVASEGVVLKICNSNGIQSEKIIASDIKKTVDNGYGWDADKVTYRFARSYRMELSDFMALESTVSSIFAVNGVHDIESVFTSSKRLSIVAELRKEACNEAMRKAKDLAEASNAEIEGVYGISDVKLGNEYVTMRDDDMSSRAAYAGLAQMRFSSSVPDYIEIEASVDGLFKLKMH